MYMQAGGVLLTKISARFIMYGNFRGNTKLHFLDDVDVQENDPNNIGR
jgi:hypothetical protein